MHEYDGPPINWPKGAVAMTKNLDLLTEEPLELAHALRKLAEKRVEQGEGDDEEWTAFSAAMERLVETLEALNQPKSRASDAEKE
jgi:hypothetical protein